MAHGFPVSSKTYDYEAMVLKREPKLKEPEKAVYAFSNGREYQEPLNLYGRTDYLRDANGVAVKDANGEYIYGADG